MTRIHLLILALGTSAGANALNVQFYIWNEQCGNNNGRVEALVWGGQFPYTYSWSNGGTASIITGLDAGTYTLTVTDALSAQLVMDAVVIDVPEIQIPDFAWSGQVMGQGQVVVSNAGLSACPGLCNGAFSWDPSLFTPNVMGPVTYDPPPDPMFVTWTNPVFTWYCPNDMPVLQITDATGCTGTFQVTPIVGANVSPMQVTSVEAACGPTGSITVDPGGPENYGADMQLYDATWQPIGLPLQVFTGTQATFQNLVAGDYHVQRTLIFTAEPCPVSIDITVPSAGNPCGTVSGSLYLDHDQDCAQDIGDEAVPYRVIEVQPGPVYMITNSSGFYDLGLAYGNFTVAQEVGTDLHQLCPVASPVPFTIDGTQSDVVIDFADSSLIALDLESDLGHGTLRPGFTTAFYCHVNNLGGQLSAPVDLTFTYDPVLVFISADPAPTSIVGNTLTWSGLPALGAFGAAAVHVDLQVPPNPALIGTTVTNTFLATQAFTEADPANNAVSHTTMIMGSYDPNDKTVSTSTGWSDEHFFIGEDEYMDYTIRFQNTGTDTAFTVVVTDTLSTALDMSTFQQGLASHPFEVSFLPGRVVEWRFENILLPDSNVNETASHGLVKFRIRPTQPLAAGTLLGNNADIFFDFNPPIRTNDALLTAEFSTAVRGSVAEPGQLEVMPNPASDRVFVRSNNGLMSEVMLIAPDGRVVLMNAPNAGSLAIDLGSLAPGIYAMRVRLQDGRMIERSIVKQ